MAHVYTKLKEYDNAIAQLSVGWEVYEAKLGRNCEEIGRVYLELAKVYLKKKGFDEAIDY